MSNEIIELEKTKLKEHYDRFLRSDPSIKFLHFRFLFDQINRTPGFKVIHQQLCQECSLQHHFRLNQVMHNKERPFIEDDYPVRMAISATLAKNIIEQNNQNYIISIGKKYSDSTDRPIEHYYRVYTDLFLDPYISHLMLTVDRNLILLDLFRQYKKRSEWFNKSYLIRKTEDAPRTEYACAEDLYLYLFDNGIEFHLEAASPNGRIDFLAAQKMSGSRVLAEVKVLKENNHPQTFLRKSITQILRYAKDYHERAGYLVIFNLTPQTILFENAMSTSQLEHYIYEGITINFIVINLFLRERTASQEKYQQPLRINVNELFTTT